MDDMRLIPPQYVKPSRPGMRFVLTKSAKQQAQGIVLKVRETLIDQRTRLANAIRGHAVELGVIAAKGGQPDRVTTRGDRGRDNDPARGPQDAPQTHAIAADPPVRYSIFLLSKELSVHTTTPQTLVAAPVDWPNIPQSSYMFGVGFR
jgi:hypothetical protein